MNGYVRARSPMRFIALPPLVGLSNFPGVLIAYKDCSIVVWDGPWPCSARALNQFVDVPNSSGIPDVRFAEDRDRCCRSRALPSEIHHIGNNSYVFRQPR